MLSLLVLKFSNLYLQVMYYEFMSWTKYNCRNTNNGNTWSYES